MFKLWFVSLIILVKTPKLILYTFSKTTTVFSQSLSRCQVIVSWSSCLENSASHSFLFLCATSTQKCLCWFNKYVWKLLYWKCPEYENGLCAQSIDKTKPHQHYNLLRKMLLLHSMKSFHYKYELKYISTVTSVNSTIYYC